MSSLPPPRSEDQREADELAKRKAMEEMADRDNEEVTDESQVKRSKTEMIHQDFLMDQEMTVGEALQETAMEIKAFFRYEVGQALPGEEE